MPLQAAPRRPPEHCVAGAAALERAAGLASIRRGGRPPPPHSRGLRSPSLPPPSPTVCHSPRHARPASSRFRQQAIPAPTRQLGAWLQRLSVAMVHLQRQTEGAAASADRRRRLPHGRGPPCCRRAAATCLAFATVFTCLTLAARGSPQPSRHGAAAAAGRDGGDAADVAPSWTSRATTFTASGPCSTPACLSRWKAGFIVALFVEGLAGGAAPQALHYLKSPERALHIANAFGGGIFLATGMLHVLPEAVEHLAGHGHGEEHEGEHEEHAEGEEHEDHAHEEEGEEEGRHPFPTAYALAVGAFYAILVIEHLLLGKYAHSHSHAATVAHDTAAAKGVSYPVPLGSATDPEGGVVPEAGFGEAADSTAASPADASNHDDMLAVGKEGALGGGPSPMPKDVTVPIASAAAGGLVQRSASARSVASDGAASNASGGSQVSSQGQLLAEENVGFLSTNFTRALLAAFSLSIHSVFESLALGLASSWSTALHTFIAIGSHKWATSASLGIKFEKERLRRRQLAVLVFLWAAVTPVSAGIGAAITGGIGDTTAGVLFALSAGMFIYIGAFEVVRLSVGLRGAWFTRVILGRALGCQPRVLRVGLNGAIRVQRALTAVSGRVGILFGVHSRVCPTTGRRGLTQSYCAAVCLRLDVPCCTALF